MTHFCFFCGMFEKAVIQKNKKIIIGGYDIHGAYCNWLIKFITGEHADIIIDDNLCIYGVNIYRELALDDIPADEYIGIVPNDLKYDEMFKRHGIDSVVLKDVFGCEKFGFYEWLESKFGVDLVKTIVKEDFDYDYSFSTNSGASRQMGLLDVLLDVGVKKDNSILDIGCGKGGAMAIMNQMCFSKVDGIELSKSISDIARSNMKKLGYSSNIENISALEFDRYAEYDVLYMYDPFRDDLFRRVLDKIAESVMKSDKNVMIIYANPYHHKDVMSTGAFDFIRAVDTDFFHRNVKIYMSKR